jgi:Ala-tRNA(Pro) deacylase
MTTRQELFKFLESLDIRVQTVDHPAVFTVAESAELDRRIPGGHTKNLFLRDARDALYLVVAHAHTRVDLKALARRLGASGRFSFGRPDLLQQVLGVTPGSVTIFALINDSDRRVAVVVDEALMAFDTINGHPLENTATTNIARRDLFRFIRACGHEPRILYLGSDQPGAPP